MFPRHYYEMPPLEGVVKITAARYFGLLAALQ